MLIKKECDDIPMDMERAEPIGKQTYQSTLSCLFKFVICLLCANNFFKKLIISENFNIYII